MYEYFLGLILVTILIFIYCSYTKSCFAPSTSTNLSNQISRLRVRNAHTETIWIQHSDNVPDKQNVMLLPGKYYDYNIPAGRLEATRFWAKTGCNPDGSDCQIGQSMAPCPPGGCQPPLESKLEVTWADTKCPTKGAGANCVTWYNASQVDGYTLPFTIRPLGNGSTEPGCQFVDASALDLARCPSNEDLSGGGKYPQYKNVDLRIFSKSDPSKIIGCMSPCKKLNYPAPWGYGIAEISDPALHMCCPTDGTKINNGTCTWANSCATSSACSNSNDPLGVTKTQYVKYIRGLRANNPDAGIYSYAYDDANGLHTCPAQTKFELVFGAKK